MSELINTEKRQLVPRWHDSAIGLQQAKWKARKKADYQNEREIIQADFEAWSTDKPLPIAIELAEKLHNFNFDIPDIESNLFKYLRKYKQSIPIEALFLIEEEQQLQTSENKFGASKIRIRIKELRSRLRDFQSDPLAWHDLAFCYSVLNEDEKANKCLMVALKSSGNHPYIARSYSRFLVHNGDYDKAAQLLARIGSNDPRIVSAELAIRARFDVGKPNLKLARDLIDRHESTPGLISELAASVATIDYQVGHDKRARKYINSAMLDMTENVEAHLRWLLQKSKVETPATFTGVFMSPEATAIDLYEKDMLWECRDSLIDVYEFQPFSAASLIDATSLSIALGDNESVISLSSEYNFAIGRNELAQNNIAVALILNNELDKATRIVRDLENTKFSTDSESTFLATKGLLSYRTGDPLNGSRLYDLARERLSGSSKRELEALASSFQASEEIKVNRDAGIVMLRHAEKESAHSSLKKEIRSFTKLVREQNNVLD